MLRRIVIRRLLIVIPVVLALALTGLFLPAREVSIEPYGMLSLESKITLSVGYEVAYASPDPGWLSGWDKRIKLTVDSGDIDAALSDFPILVYISTSSGYNSDDVSCVFDELTSDDNRKKIAVTLGEDTECYVEIEKWDDANEKAWLWVKVPSIADDADTDLYLYYDSTHADNDAYVGDPNSTPAENVWDTNFKLVTHMRDDPDTSHIRDSTENNNDGAKTGAGEPAVTTDGKIDDAQHFDGADDDITVADAASLDITTNITLEVWVNNL